MPTHFSFRPLVALGLLAAAPLLAPAQAPAKVKTKLKRSAAAPAPRVALAPTPIANPVLAGDYPDPSVTQVGDTYWATATSSNWGPTFPLLKSTDLQHWTLVGHVFPGERPAWADYYFWAPEINHDANGKTYVFYTAHQRGGLQLTEFRVQPTSYKFNIGADVKADFEADNGAI